MKKIYILAFISGLLMTAGMVVGLFAPFLGEVLGICGVMIPLMIFIAVLFVAMAERGY